MCIDCRDQQRSARPTEQLACVCGLDALFSTALNAKVWKHTKQGENTIDEPAKTLNP